MQKSGCYFLVALFCGILAFASVTDAEVITGQEFQQRGEDILSTIERDYGRWDDLYNQGISQQFPSFAWGQGIMFSALVAAADVDSSHLDTAKAHAHALHDNYRCYEDGIWGYNAGAGGCGDRYYDDNAWIALGMTELYEVTGDWTYMDWAKEIVAFSMSGENGPGDTPDGGIRWHESDTGGASICSTAPTCLANLRIYQLTGIESYLTDGLRLYDWLINADNYRYSTGIFHETNEGPLGYQTAVVTQAAVSLYEITGDESYLQQAQEMAYAMEEEFVNSSTNALGQTGKWGGHDMTNAYVDLYKVDRNPYWLNIAAGYIEYLYDNCRDSSTGRYPADWHDAGDPPSDDLLDQASVARAYWKMASVAGGGIPLSGRIRNRVAGRYLHTVDSVIGTVVIYDSQPYSDRQYWTITDQGGGYFSIRSRQKDGSLQLYRGRDREDNRAVVAETNPDEHYQQWSFTDVGNGYFNIRNRLGGRSLQPLNSGTGNNTTAVVHTTDLNQQSQHWEFTGGEIPTSTTGYISANSGEWQQTGQITVDAGDNVSLKVEAPGTGDWNWSGPAGFSSTDTEITLQDIQANAAGNYAAVYTNDSGAESICGFEIDVNTFVSLYQHCDYGGWRSSLGVGGYTSSDLIDLGGLNNDASSVKVAPGYAVTLYSEDDFQGETLTVTSDNICLVDEGWNDRVSSVLVETYTDPAAHWSFNDGSGSALSDISGNGRDGQLVNMGQNNWVSGKRCGGLYFNGTDDYVEISGYKGVSGAASRTCTGWIKTTKDSAEILSWGSTDTGGKWIIRTNNDGTLRAEVNGGYIYGTTDIADGQWHHIAVVLQNDGNPGIDQALLYVDGEPETIGGSQYCRVDTADSDNVKIGLYSASERYFEGVIDEVRIYPRALDESEIQQIYLEGALTADMEPDGDVDFSDFTVLVDFWGTSGNSTADLNCDGIVDINDLTVFVDEWLSSVSMD